MRGRDGSVAVSYRVLRGSTKTSTVGEAVCTWLATTRKVVVVVLQTTRPEAAGGKARHGPGAGAATSHSIASPHITCRCQDTPYRHAYMHTYVHTNIQNIHGYRALLIQWSIQTCHLAPGSRQVPLQYCTRTKERNKEKDAAYVATMLMPMLVLCSYYAHAERFF